MMICPQQSSGQKSKQWPDDRSKVKAYLSLSLKSTCCPTSQTDWLASRGEAPLQIFYEVRHEITAAIAIAVRLRSIRNPPTIWTREFADGQGKIVGINAHGNIGTLEVLAHVFSLCWLTRCKSSSKPYTARPQSPAFVPAAYRL